MFLAAALSLTLLQSASDPALLAEVKAADAALFETFFERCDPARLASQVTPDFEMYHDKDGVVATSGDAFVALYAKGCEAKKAPDAWRSRRALLPETLRVDPVPGYGAIEEGDHVFYERQGDGPEKLVGKAHFVQLWKKGPDGWRVARILSYAHQAVR
ncbi:nuclear transport factor 2 family protein [Sphingomonas sp. NIBR02145]|uniref:nuclear transport factor 2 family protein n=1 Tax=Sphingomonas sp. NIBR02145 TaxID=3014784 RepID=UPI0022B39C43|nr:nuclear transport factor 2 family protein [Sphingomonas sp. NIBR02145]WHU01385.1 nuclear transport factor 2 family protein [Sphingomonas sp. NIBR02145]